MPRPRSSYWPILTTATTIAASGTYQIELDLIDTFYPQILTCATYLASSDQPLTCTIYPGFQVDTQGTVSFAANGNSIVDFASYPPSSGLTVNVAFAIDPNVYPRYLNVVYTNPNSDGVQIKVYGDR